MVIRSASAQPSDVPGSFQALIYRNAGWETDASYDLSEPSPPHKKAKLPAKRLSERGCGRWTGSKSETERDFQNGDRQTEGDPDNGR
ncbi:uncharacterized protein PG986_006442 [Apiospora aurea]|uniref:Uncharacterized protein n=1 Tax=Apiospora aurea TaxID=335848 RepID=A0ABR1QKN6_9PEZI